MKRCALEQNIMAACDNSKDSMVCPKPRRLYPLLGYSSYNSDRDDLKAGTELLDIILSKGSGLEKSGGNQVASSPPFFCGSPPSRVSNPLVQDQQFGSDNFKTYSAVPTLSASPSSIGRKGGCVRAVLGQKPTAVRIEGFDCLSRDRQNCSISAFA